MSSFPRNFAFCIVFFTIVLRVQAQSLPTTNIFCFDMDKFGEQYEFKNPKFMSGFNPMGYNNQPNWVNNNEIYMSVMTPRDTFQTDIYSLSFLNNVLTRVTATPESEYSPTLTPDRRHFSCVRVDVGRNPAQRLWIYPIDRSDAGRDLLPLHQAIGYHIWLTDKKVALFILDGKAKNYLKIVNVDDQSSIQLTPGIGRSFGKFPDGKLAFIQKASAQTWYIKSLDPISYSSDIVIQTLPGSEDFAILPDGTIFMGNGSKLYMYKTGDAQKEWREVMDFARYGIFSIKRLAINRDLNRIALVTDIPRGR